MFETSNLQSNKLWMWLSVLIAAITLFGAVFWAPAHGHSTELYWIVFILMSLHAYFLDRGDKKARGEHTPQQQV